MSASKPVTPCKDSPEDPWNKILDTMGVTKFFPAKITLHDVTSLKQMKDVAVSMKDIPWNILDRLLMLDRRCRDGEIGKCIHDIQSESNSGKQVSFGINKRKKASSPEGNKQKTQPPHPLDALLVLFRCSDFMLQQMMAHKLYMCRLAIPFITPSSASSSACKLMLWPLRDIVMEWKDTQKNAMESSLATHKMNFVTFIRLGTPSISKSKLLNEVISDTVHGTFFNRECSHGKARRLVSNGLVEVSNYLPSGKDGDHFNVPVGFLNLHGNVSSFEPQAKVITRMSSVVVIISDVKDLTDNSLVQIIGKLGSDDSKLILVLTSKDKVTEERETECHTLLENALDEKTQSRIVIMSGFEVDEEPKNLSELKLELRPMISKLLQDHPAYSLEMCKALCEKEEFVIDENDENLAEAKILADNIFSLLQHCDVTKRKDELLPLQGELWRQWGQLLRRQHRFGISSESDARVKPQETVKEEMLTISKEQSLLCQKMNPVMKTFLSSLVTNVQHPQKILYFLKWMKVLLDEVSRTTLPELHSECRDKWEKVKEAMHTTPGDHIKLSTLQIAASEAERKIVATSFGLEHLFREIGQVYQAAVGANEKTEELKELTYALPQVGAELLLNGQPLEFLDGDCGTLPLVWIKAVLKSLLQIIGNKKVFVLSVLGIQSSGKSTLLNTMFGMEFAVSAGRCTRGIFAQLLPVDQSDASWPFEYMLILDSEGLRAPELSEQNYEHDNELATLIIGLADLVLINLKGENTAEMKDILQIVVHAFLRMKAVESYKQQRCVFLHQNVPALAAREKMRHGHQKLQESLDKMTREAAETENMAFTVQFFNQVIDFDGDKHVWYFSDLWAGDPPMAPVNHGYSEMALEVKASILTEFINHKPSCITLSDLITRIEDMWKGVLADDFVFSFRNSLAVKAYISIEKKLSELIRTFESELLGWANSECKIKIDNCSNEADLKDTCDKLAVRLYELKSEKGDKLQSNFDTFLQNHSSKQIVVQWKEEKKATINANARTIVSQMEMEIEQLQQEKLVEIKQLSKAKSYEKIIITKAMELAETLKGKSPSKDQLKTEFKGLWRDWLDELLPRSSEDQRDAVLQDMISTLHSAFTSKGHYIYLKRYDLNMQTLRKDPDHLGNQLYGSIAQSDIKKEHISLKNAPMVGGIQIKRSLLVTKEEFLAQAVSGTNVILKGVDNRLQELCHQDVKFHKSYEKQIIDKMFEGIDRHNELSYEKAQFTFTPQFEAMLAVRIAQFAILKFDEMSIRYEKRYGVMSKLMAYRQKVFNIFQNKVKESAAEVTAADIFCDSIKDSIHGIVTKDMGRKIVDQVLSDFSHSKYHLVVTILDNIAADKMFDDAMEYIQQSKDYASSWLRKYTNNKFFVPLDEQNGQCEYSVIANRHMTKVMLNIEKSIQKATDASDKDTHGEKMKTWIKEFCTNIETDVPVSPDQLQMMIMDNGPQVTSFSHFKQLLLKRLVPMQDHITAELSKVNSENVVWEGQNPYEQIMLHLWGCPAQCPFCHEPCQKNDPSHYDNHQCIQHRPSGIQGVRVFDESKLCHTTCNYDICTDESFTCETINMECRKSNCGILVHQHHIYKEYKKCLPQWDIAPDPPGEASKFWQWFMCTFKNELVEYYNAHDAEIPNSWGNVTKKQALESLRKYIS